MYYALTKQAALCRHNALFQVRLESRKKQVEKRAHASYQIWMETKIIEPFKIITVMPALYSHSIQ